MFVYRLAMQQWPATLCARPTPREDSSERIWPIRLTETNVSASDWTADLPPDRYTEWTSELEIYVRMRDGVHLSTDVMLPNGADGKLPTLLVRTPYDKTLSPNVLEQLFLKQGYGVVVQSERGRYFSEGRYDNYLQGASTDGLDTVQWIVNQPWSNGKVGTIGCSSTAEHQWPMAITRLMPRWPRSHRVRRSATFPATTPAAPSITEASLSAAFGPAGTPTKCLSSA